ncbi:ankyrin repeat domain-containing protein 50-like [Haliotis rufescens]|uniref:ankyrin repeat domain-containing protein 50-like n=1 Tax=Haliotis rufescens TaxID=6454 RepID=UPI00201E77CB|nr:ankyrin repeat domain-containing protein 50-like [Haliotis rufescens]
MAALYGKKDTFEMLMAKGADLTLTDDNNNNVLHLACQGGNRFILERLLPLFDINCRRNEGLTGVMMAVLCGKKDTFEMLVSAGADLTLTDDFNNNVLLLASSKGGNMTIVEDVIDLFDINTRGVHGCTPLLEAASGGHMAVVGFLVSRKADVKMVDNSGNSLLHAACYYGHLGMVKHVR